MGRYRNALPQLGDEVYLADSGLETDLIFNAGFELPEFAAFVLLDSPDGVKALRDYYDRHVAVAREAGRGIVLEAPTWRASEDWGARVGADTAALAAANRDAVGLLTAVRDSAGPTTVVISGSIGPRHDAYRPDRLMAVDEAERYHSAQVDTFAGTDADLVTAMTLTYVDEAVGIARAARAAGVPAVLSFTVETDGALPDGTRLGDAITRVDAATDGYVSYFMVNCAHPSHFEDELDAEASWAPRVRGLRANASRMSHEELDAAPELDAGDPVELAADYAALVARMPSLRVVGGCCGTDARHIEQIAAALG